MDYKREAQHLVECWLSSHKVRKEPPTILLCQSGYLSKSRCDGRDSLILASPESWQEM